MTPRWHANQGTLLGVPVGGLRKPVHTVSCIEVVWTHQKVLRSMIGVAKHTYFLAAHGRPWSLICLRNCLMMRLPFLRGNAFLITKGWRFPYLLHSHAFPDLMLLVRSIEI